MTKSEMIGELKHVASVVAEFDEFGRPCLPETRLPEVADRVYEALSIACGDRDRYKECLRAIGKALGIAHLDAMIDEAQPGMWSTSGAAIKHFEEQQRAQVKSDARTIAAMRKELDELRVERDAEHAQVVSIASVLMQNQYQPDGWPIKNDDGSIDETGFCIGCGRSAAEGCSKRCAVDAALQGRAVGTDHEAPRSTAEERKWDGFTGIGDCQITISQGSGRDGTMPWSWGINLRDGHLYWLSKVHGELRDVLADALEHAPLRVAEYRERFVPADAPTRTYPASMPIGVTLIQPTTEETAAVRLRYLEQYDELARRFGWSGDEGDTAVAFFERELAGMRKSASLAKVDGARTDARARTLVVRGYDVDVQENARAAHRMERFVARCGVEHEDSEGAQFSTWVAETGPSAVLARENAIHAVQMKYIMHEGELHDDRAVRLGAIVTPPSIDTPR